MTLKYPGQGRMLPARRRSSSGTCIFGAEDPASKANNAPSSIHNNSSHSTPFSVSHVNICSLRNKIYELCRILHSHDIDVLALSETWLDSSVPDAHIHTGYTNHRHDRLTGQERGVCFLVKASIAVRPYLNSDTTEAVFITILDKRRPVLLLGCVDNPGAPVS